LAILFINYAFGFNFRRGNKKMSKKIFCKDCKYYKEQKWTDFCYYWGSKITKIERNYCEGYSPIKNNKKWR
jgi:hypothetical protein